MAICLLARHGTHDLIASILVGRFRDVGLNETGAGQAAALARRAKRLRITNVQSSPQRRCIETAAAVADRLGLEIEICPALDEIDFGDWAGRSFAELERDPLWHRWNLQRSIERPPCGESMREAQDRVVGHLRRAQNGGSDKSILMVTHAEIVRAAILAMSGLPIDAWSQIAVAPGSVTRVALRTSHDAAGALAGIT